MRKVSLYGIDDKLMCDLSRDVDVIVKIMEIGEAIDAITFKKIFTGIELKSFMKENKIEDVMLKNNELLIDKIVDDNKYEVKAYDW